MGSADPFSLDELNAMEVNAKALRSMADSQLRYIASLKMKLKDSALRKAASGLSGERAPRKGRNDKKTVRETMESNFLKYKRKK